MKIEESSLKSPFSQQKQNHINSIYTIDNDECNSRVQLSVNCNYSCNNNSEEDLKDVTVSSASEVSGDITSGDESDLSEKKCRFLGLFLTFVSGFLYALSTLIAKVLKDEYHPFLISVWRFQGVFLPCLFILLWHLCWGERNILQPLWPITDKGKCTVWGAVMLRGIIGCWAVVLQFYSIQYLDIGDSTVITSSTSVFVTLLAHCFIQEKCALIPIITAILTILGVVVIAQPPLLTGHEQLDIPTLKGVGLALGCMMISAAVIVWQRFLRNVHYSVISLSSGLWGTIECLVLTFLFNEFQWPHTWTHTLYAAALATLTLFAQISIIVALKIEQAGPVALVQSADSISAFIWQFLLLGVIPNEYSIIGTGIIITGVLLTAMRRWLDDLPKTNPKRKMLGFLLY